MFGNEEAGQGILEAPNELGPCSGSILITNSLYLEEGSGEEEEKILTYDDVVNKFAWIFKIKLKIFKEIPCLWRIASSD